MEQLSSLLNACHKATLLLLPKVFDDLAVCENLSLYALCPSTTKYEYVGTALVITCFGPKGTKKTEGANTLNNKVPRILGAKNT